MITFFKFILVECICSLIGYKPLKSLIKQVSNVSGWLNYSKFEKALYLTKYCGHGFFVVVDFIVGSIERKGFRDYGIQLRFLPKKQLIERSKICTVSSLILDFTDILAIHDEDLRNVSVEGF
ncbi:MAG: hypothetical protein BWY04_00896 [candidate division CPR1 bacterium ADurb.Bin160]|jgi:hypothetical protein|uniref:Uncharacterized protein n=1 Tax=candidate division CPR1 bacterium ADurb.Bin160 TaxID=1852826 RepID=A0A1V5ZMP1_9BACT|nr:MAG: hypothetical protein BWY04_00896 [candidate division CPR1 bacterium ADurb.Bin160]